MATLPLLSQPLDDGRVRLRDAAERDIPEVLIAFEDDPHLHVRLARERPPTGGELGRAAQTEAADRASGERATLTIAAPGADLCLGQVEISTVDWEHARADIAVWLAPAARRNGLGAGALALAGDWLLGDCGLVRLQGFAEPGNTAAIAAAQRAGFVPEGVLRGYLRRRGRRIDVAVLGRAGAAAAAR